MPATSLEPRKVPKQARAQRTVERILDAAADVFIERGYAASTTNRIAEAAGLSIGSLYQYFPNKDSILVALAGRHVDEGARTVWAAWESAAAMGGIRDRLALLIGAVLASGERAVRLHRVLFEEAPRPPELRARLRETETQLVQAATRLLAGDPEVRHRDLASAAWVVVATVGSLVHRYLAGEAPPRSESFQLEVVDLVVKYLTAA